MKFYICLSLLFFSYTMRAQDCSQTSTGYIPIADLGKETFKGFTGGRYPGGSNKIPAEHFSKGIALSKQIIPLDANGIENKKGTIGFMILGFSTAAMTGRYFRNLSMIKKINPDVKIIIGAQGGQDINTMIDENSQYYTVIDSILQAQNVSSKQIQVIWISTGDIANYMLLFPQQSIEQTAKYQLLLALMKNKFPNLKIVFISDRPYAGYIGNDAGPQELKEPTAYYTSWAIKWLIQKQVNNERGYSTDEIPFIDWGPMLWTDGEKGNKQGYKWMCDDAGKGGIHASPKGRAKEACLLYLYFTAHPYSKNWFYSLK